MKTNTKPPIKEGRRTAERGEEQNQQLRKDSAADGGLGSSCWSVEEGKENCRVKRQ